MGLSCLCSVAYILKINRKLRSCVYVHILFPVLEISLQSPNSHFIRTLWLNLKLLDGQKNMVYFGTESIL